MTTPMARRRRSLRTAAYGGRRRRDKARRARLSLREMLGWSLDTTCGRAGNVDVARLSKYERSILPMRKDQVERVRRVLEIEMAGRARRFRDLVASREAVGA